MKLKVKKLNSEAKLPAYNYHGDAGMDLFALETVRVEPGEIARIRSGIAVEIPEGCVGLCWDKSGKSINHGIKVLAGVIDSGFRGELVMGVINLSKESYTFEKGHKVMQMLIQKVEYVDIEEVENLSEAERGEHGFGSTGK
ncbi:MAG: deoxyuridine 5'-triphosphate nucleotidohydrolase [Candidatus Zambryskibacteria bacterium RIFOXYC1_FULL_39_10]|uniref:dUTP diphosphatase n=1 Tax=Candidatus Zambryskibacteria bacterium RIFOXYC1_FULL_39_10 TaxID=1802779 RepID=A0A1G2V420_9BACT|nr:MAG: deoxyuridine 5'-triphosphate nucleotidohydrolase [Candidatus Zambryskibacteria bacterium RIFOXYD1_FULL_39_35]OHB16378.1 MAG: deoxyuridine 5'-triphosphate nucleotidohydrolase [Candidatus Zambryskibacteria bacterium RIFOXYC1_FULL_39_10]